MASARIDFEAQLLQQKKKTEYLKPHTMTQAADALFIDKQTFVALEFNYYQNECQYIKLRRIEEQQDGSTFKDINDKPVNHKLATHRFQMPELPVPPAS